MKITGKIFTLVLFILFFVGLCILLYPAISQYWNSKVQSRAVVEYIKDIDGVSIEDYTELFSQAFEYNTELSMLDNPLTDFYKVSRSYIDCLNVSATGMMGYIAIDKIQVELPIYHGTGNDILSFACGHLAGSSLPVGGSGTHCVLSAHRGLPNAKLFTNLDKLQIGDTFTITILGEVLTYQVDQIKIVLPNDFSELKIVPGKDYCTLLTCTPYGINSHRLLVRGTRIASISQRKLVISSEAYRVDKLIVTPIVAIPILFILIVYIIFKPVKHKIKIDEE